MNLVSSIHVCFDAVTKLQLKNIGSMKAMGLPICRYLCPIVAHIKMEHADVRS